jgi:hypothetical protein
VHVAGSGDVRVAGGRASDFDVTVAGSGDVHFGGVADNLKARIMGSGDVPRPPGDRPYLQDDHGLWRGQRRKTD